MGRRIHKIVGESFYAAAFIGSNIVYEHLYSQGTFDGTNYRHFHGVSGYEGSLIYGAPFIARKNYKGDVIEYIYYPTHEIIEQEYSNYGDALSEHTYDGYPLPPYGYSSGYTDSETGLQYLINRYYDPAAARFTQEDNNFIDGYNLYAYCGNDPINYTDPFGRCCEFNTVWNTALTSNPYFSCSSQGLGWSDLCLEYDAHSQGYASRAAMESQTSMRNYVSEAIYPNPNIETEPEYSSEYYRELESDKTDDISPSTDTSIAPKKDLVDMDGDEIGDCYIYTYTYTKGFWFWKKQHIGRVYIYVNKPTSYFEDSANVPSDFNKMTDLMVADYTSAENPNMYAYRADRVKAKYHDEIIDCLLQYDADFNTPWVRTRKSLLVEWEQHNIYAIADRARNIDFDNAEEGKGFVYFFKKAIDAIL